MPFGPFPTEILPKALVAALAAWGAANYFVVGPTLASRIVRADHLPACEANFRDMVAKAGEQRAKSLTLPSIDPMQEFATEQARRVLDSPAMQQLRIMSGGLAEQFGLDVGGAVREAQRQVEASKHAARGAYNDALEKIKAETASNLAGAGSVCGCIGDAAIADSRTEWAIFSGTLSLVQLAPLDRFDQKMAQIHGAGACQAAKAGGQ